MSNITVRNTSGHTIAAKGSDGEFYMIAPYAVEELPADVTVESHPNLVTAVPSIPVMTEVENAAKEKGKK